MLAMLQRLYSMHSGRYTHVDMVRTACVTRHRLLGLMDVLMCDILRIAGRADAMSRVI